MILGNIWSVALIILVQCIGFSMEGGNVGRRVNNSCRNVEKLVSPCNKQMHLDSESSSVKNRCTFFSHNSNTLTFYLNVNDTNKELRVSLFRGINKMSTVCDGFFNASQLPFDYNNCRIIPSASYVTFQLQSLHENDTDIYFFCKEVMYPPPYIFECDEGTIIHVKEYKQHKEIIEIQKPHLSVLIILGCIAAYSLIITASFIYILRKRRRTRIQQSEYINVVPRRPKNNKPYMPYATNPIHPCTR
ncbi:T-cell-specific surface glycoprotein CD28-like [Anomaloglossus baeobatrachus]|uniref:T-cell-specific surface glycoprotein CD28-like n=1 Tax=Anomaloglossus baeobatrachus TaxID=238106 RepID=UPI003F4FF9D1